MILKLTVLKNKKKFLVAVLLKKKDPDDFLNSIELTVVTNGFAIGGTHGKDDPLLAGEALLVIIDEADDHPSKQTKKH